MNSVEKQIIAEIHDYIKNECKGFSKDDVFKNHILEVRNFAILLAKEYNANLFVVTIAAYLHDIYHIQTKNHEMHEIEGSKFVKKYLKQFDIPNKEIKLISLCVLNHRGSKKNNRESIEEKIIACADAMDHINRYELMFERFIERLGVERANAFMKEKIKRGWNKIELEKGREIVKGRYNEAKKKFE